MMAATSIPGLDVIQAAAAKAGIDISATITKAQQIMATDPAGIRAGGQRLRGTAAGLDTTAQGVRRTGMDVLANWSGQSATAFGPRHAEVVNQIGGHQQDAAALAEQCEAVAATFESKQQTVLTATGICATAIGAQQATP
jgi:hypothetical protein